MKLIQSGFSAPLKEDITLIVDNLDNEPLRFEQDGSQMTIKFLAPEGFSSTLQFSTNMREWTVLAKVETGDGAFHSFDLNLSGEAFYRAVFEPL